MNWSQVAKENGDLEKAQQAQYAWACPSRIEVSQEREREREKERET
jgi:hypothetical protein